MWAGLQHSAHWVRDRFELTSLMLVAVLAAGVWVFIAVADEVVENETHAWDQAVILAMRTPGDPADPIGPGWLEEIGRDLTALGGIAVLTLLTAASVIFLRLQNKTRAMWFVLGAVLGGQLLSFSLKFGFDRPRPDLVSHGSYVYTTSFPSGHSMLAAVTYLTLGGLLARVQSRRRIKIYLLTLAVLLTGAVGVSRVYLGVHWPTDVIAGWALGASWACLCWLIARWLQRRGQVEATAESPHEAAPIQGQNL